MRDRRGGMGRVFVVVVARIDEWRRFGAYDPLHIARNLGAKSGVGFLLFGTLYRMQQLHNIITSKTYISPRFLVFFVILTISLAYCIWYDVFYSNVLYGSLFSWFYPGRFLNYAFNKCPIASIFSKCNFFSLRGWNHNGKQAVSFTCGFSGISWEFFSGCGGSTNGLESRVSIIFSRFSR